MFYDIYNIRINGFTNWSGKIYVRKNETVRESIKRHFPKYDKKKTELGLQYEKSNIVLIGDILIEDLKDYLIDNIKIIER